MLEICANSLLFLSGLLLLADVAPHDLLPIHKRRVRAFNVLREKKNIILKSKGNITINPGSSRMSLAEDDESLLVISEFIQRKSPVRKAIDWSRVIGVGYAVTSVPFGRDTIDAFKTLYLALIPKGEVTELELVTIGQLDDLYAWLEQQRQGAITQLAMVLLVVGFLLQLISSIMKP